MSTHRLSQLDAFFVAYQEAAGIAMQLGVEVQLDRDVSTSAVRDCLLELTRRWPRLGQLVRAGLFGLSFRGEVQLGAMLQKGGREARISWRNRTIDPFSEPPFQVLVARESDATRLCFRVHHAVADGESFLMLVSRVLVGLAGTALTPTEGLNGGGQAGEDLVDLLSWRHLTGVGHLPSLVRYACWLAAESRIGRSAPLYVDDRDPGDIDICQERLTLQASRRLRERARGAGVSPAMLTCAAWVRAIYRWNRAHGAGDCPLISLELPASLRRGADGGVRVGNFISPLLLFADASHALLDVARDLREQVRKAIQQRSYLALPLLTSPARYLPWPVLRKAAADTTFSGFATSHFAWLEQDSMTRAALNQGSLAIVAHTLYTPVCLHMGAALSALVWEDRVQLVITHRLRAIPPSRVRRLLDLVAEEVSGSPSS